MQRSIVLDTSERGQTLSKRVYEEHEAALRPALINAQYDLQESGSPVIVLIAGDDRPAASDVLNRLHEWMDVRYLDTHAFGPATEREALRPVFWRYWNALPKLGRVGVYVGSWALSPLAARLEGRMDDATFERWIERSRNLVAMLAADGAVFVNLWLHLPKKEHEKRLAKARKGRGDTWRVDETDWRICDRYTALAPLATEFLERTDSEHARWQIVETTNGRHRDVTCAQRILEGMERAIAPSHPAPTAPTAPAAAAAAPNVLDRVDLSATLDPEVYKTTLGKLQRKLFKLAKRAEEKRIRTLLVFEGWDAAGKGGVIRRTVHALDARDYRVVPIGAPNEEERQYHYLWRFWRQIPRAGQMVIFDRSWYGRVLVERVEGFASEVEWRRAYREINEFERELVEADTVLLKFWLHIDPDEQLRRFRERERTAYKKYKITDEDYRNRDQWDAYVDAINDMVAETNPPSAPWHLVPANDKRVARVAVIETLCEALKRAVNRRKKR